MNDQNTKNRKQILLSEGFDQDGEFRILPHPHECVRTQRHLIEATKLLRIAREQIMNASLHRSTVDELCRAIEALLETIEEGEI